MKKLFSWWRSRNIFLEPCFKKDVIAQETGFTGSSAHLFFEGSRKILIVDGRYALQAKNQAQKNVEVVVDSPMSYLKRQPVSALALNAWMFSVSEVQDIKKALPEWTISIEKTPMIWPDEEKSFLWPVKTDRSFQEKCHRIFGHLSRPLWITNGSDLAWLSGLRGDPEMGGYGVVWHEKNHFHLKVFTPHQPPQKKMDFITFEKNPPCVSGSYFYDPKTLPYGFVTDQGQAFDLSGLRLLRAQKTPLEQEGMRRAQKADSVAFLRLLWDMEEHAMEESPSIQTEKEWAAHLESLRQKNSAYLAPSFNTILAYGVSGACIHHQPTDQPVGKGLCLLDAGGHYFFGQEEDLCGTTDITRTFWLGHAHPDEKTKRYFTYVLQGHIELARLKFPQGTKGGHLDAIARAPLWHAGLDYPHSTGHGVGCALSVHEAPPSISLHSKDDILPGMIFSNEPGYYEAGWGGVRLESEVLVCAKGNFMILETLSLVPFDKKLIDKTMLSCAQLEWINAYHARIEQELAPVFPDRLRDKLHKACAPLGF